MYRVASGFSRVASSIPKGNNPTKPIIKDLFSLRAFTSFSAQPQPLFEKKIHNRFPILPQNIPNIAKRNISTNLPIEPGSIAGVALDLKPEITNDHSSELDAYDALMKFELKLVSGYTTSKEHKNTVISLLKKIENPALQKNLTKHVIESMPLEELPNALESLGVRNSQDTSWKDQMVSKLI